MATQKNTNESENLFYIKKEVSRLNDRMVQLVDEIFVLKNDLNKFKTDVSSDVKYLTDRVDG